MAILVTGGAGYIGSHTVRYLENSLYNVVVYDNLVTGHAEAINGSTLVRGDLLDTALLIKTIQQYQVTDVIHFAAYSLVGEGEKNPQKYYQNNVCGTLSLLKAMLQCDVKNIIFSSSAAVYGQPQKVPITEDAECNPVNTYGRTKVMIESILEDYRRAYGLKYISLRYFNACGAAESGIIGEDHNPETHLIPIIMDCVNGKREKLTIFGDDYNTPDGTCIRDYIHVNDLANAHVLAVEYLKADQKSGIYNLGYGKGYSVKEIVNAVEDITAKKVKVEIGPRRLGDPAVLVADSIKIKKEMGWQPRYNNLGYIIKTAWQWHKKNPNGFKTP